MREERLEVSVTFDERRGYIGSAAELRSPLVALCWAACAARSRSRWCPMTFTSCCSSTVSLSANGTVGRRRRS